MIAFLFVFIGIVVALEMLYLYKRLCVGVRAFGKEPGKRVKIAFIIALCVLGVLCLDISGMPTLVVLHLTFILLIAQLVNFIIKKIAGERYVSGFHVWKRIHGSAIIPILLTATVIIGGYINLNTVRRTDYTVNTDKDIRSEGYRVALIADAHYGVSVDGDELYEKCAEISECDPDIVILCGDIVDDGTSLEGMKEIFAALGSIKSRYGIFYVYGNHDRNMASISYEFDDEELVSTILANNIIVLKDEIYSVTDDLVLVGREDRSASRVGNERKTIEALLSEVDKSDFILTLDHQPVEYEENGRAGTDLLLSGHTHGGQIWPINYISVLVSANEAVYGYTKIDSDTQAIVTSGFAGWSYPIKTAAPSEYVIIDIKP